MTQYRVEYTIDGTPCHYVVDGTRAEPSNQQLSLQDNDLTSDCTWHNDGFITVAGLPNKTVDQLRSAVSLLIANAIQTVCDREPDVRLNHYHHLVNDNEHLLVAKELKKVPFIANDFFPLGLIDNYISAILNAPESCYNPDLQRHGCSIRIIRPQSHDYNPLHRDGWLDRLRNAVNVYIPIAGSNKLSSLPLIPGSHCWNESETTRTTNGCIVNQIPFTVASVISSTRPLEMNRPCIKDNETLIFSPYLIHGGAFNFNNDMTRISLEMRFWRK